MTHVGNFYLPPLNFYNVIKKPPKVFQPFNNLSGSLSNSRMSLKCDLIYFMKLLISLLIMITSLITLSFGYLIKLNKNSLEYQNIPNN